MSGGRRMGCSSWKDGASRGPSGISGSALREKTV